MLIFTDKLVCLLIVLYFICPNLLIKSAKKIVIDSKKINTAHSHTLVFCQGQPLNVTRYYVWDIFPKCVLIRTFLVV